MAAAPAVIAPAMHCTHMSASLRRTVRVLTGLVLVAAALAHAQRRGFTGIERILRDAPG